MDCLQDPKLMTDADLTACLASFEEAIAKAEKDLQSLYSNFALAKKEQFMRKHGLKRACTLKIKAGVRRSLKHNKWYGNLCKLQTNERGEVTHFMLEHILDNERALYINVPAHRIEDMEVVND